jgi:hypothetical protein
MYARVGDRLIVDGTIERTALIIGVPHADGTPPYVVRWLATGHIAMVSPGPFGRVIRSDHGQQQHDLGEFALTACDNCCGVCPDNRAFQHLVRDLGPEPARRVPG